MKTRPETPINSIDYSGLSAVELHALIAWFQQQLELKEKALKQCDRYTILLEEQLWLKKAQQFAASSEKHTHQIHLFDEAEMEAEIEALREQLPEDLGEDTELKATRKRRQRGFSDKLTRERIEVPLSEEEKAGASRP